MQEPDAPTSAAGALRPLLYVACALWLLVVLKNAWLCDDAYITFRASYNFAHGHGPTWNAGERVHINVHPVWMFLVSAVFFVTREYFFSPLFLSIAVSCVAVWLVAFRLARTPLQGILAVVLFTCSRAFTDFSTGGLENPLSHLLLAVYALVFLRPVDDPVRRVRLLALLTAIGTLNRLDALLLFLPPLVVAAWPLPRLRALRAIAVGFLPLVAWEAFSLFYYGIPVPNIALVKLNPTKTAGQQLLLGFYYLKDSVRTDPLTLVTLGTALVFAVRRRTRAALALATGVVLYLLYIVKVGGDFMSGRFLSAPYTVAVLLIACLPQPARLTRRTVLVPVAGALALALVPAFPHLLTWRDYGTTFEHASSEHYVSSERAVYFQGSSLLAALDGEPMPRHAWYKEGLADRKQAEETGKQVVQVIRTIGFRGFAAGPDVHYIDQFALADPLLARLPALPGTIRIGHYTRLVPFDYERTVKSGENHLADPALAELYETLRLVTRGPLFDTERLATIFKLNLGAYDHLLEAYRTRSPEIVPLADIQRPDTENGTPPRPLFRFLPRSGIEIRFPEVYVSPTFEIELDWNDRFRLHYLRGDEVLAEEILGPNRRSPGFANYTVEVPPGARGTFDALRITPHMGVGNFLVGTLKPF